MYARERESASEEGERKEEMSTTTTSAPFLRKLLVKPVEVVQCVEQRVLVFKTTDCVTRQARRLFSLFFPLLCRR